MKDKIAAYKELWRELYLSYLSDGEDEGEARMLATRDAGEVL